MSLESREADDETEVAEQPQQPKAEWDGWGEASADEPHQLQTERSDTARAQVAAASQASDRVEDARANVQDAIDSNLAERVSVGDAADDHMRTEVTEVPVRLSEQREHEPEWDLADPAIQQVRDETRACISPEAWVKEINGPGMDTPGRNRNCVDCARAVESHWHGRPEVAARLVESDAPGTSQDRISEWAATEFVPTNYTDVASKLSQLGPGSSAILASDWTFGGGHAYNAVNDNGAVLLVDGQSGTIEDWPPTEAWTESDTHDCRAIFFDQAGRPMRRGRLR